jgi:hypothetical protein
VHLIILVNLIAKFVYQYSNKTSGSLYCQMCDKNKIIKNISKYIIIQEDIKQILNKFKIKLNDMVIQIRNINF